MRFPTHRSWCERLDVLGILESDHRPCLNADSCLAPALEREPDVELVA
jgi:hypothetical protein